MPKRSKPGLMSLKRRLRDRREPISRRSRKANRGR